MAKYYTAEEHSALDRAIETKRNHEDELFKIPGMRTVSLQPKITKGIRTPEFAIVVHVERKMAADELPPSEVIPRILDSVSTDVVEAARGRVASTQPPITVHKCGARTDGNR
jgi:hypothetical protein